MRASFFYLRRTHETGIMTIEAIKPNLTKAFSGSIVKTDNEEAKNNKEGSGKGLA